jgi:hypothetical protein
MKLAPKYVFAPGSRRLPYVIYINAFDSSHQVNRSFKPRKQKASENSGGRRPPRMINLILRRSIVELINHRYMAILYEDGQRQKVSFSSHLISSEPVGSFRSIGRRIQFGLYVFILCAFLEPEVYLMHQSFNGPHQIFTSILHINAIILDSLGDRRSPTTTTTTTSSYLQSSSNRIAMMTATG